MLIIKKSSSVLLMAGIIFSVTLGGCRSDEGKELSAWRENTRRIHLLQARYPAFRSVLGEIQDEARKGWDLALQIKDPVKRLEAMVQANAALTIPLIARLGEVPRLFTSIQKRSYALRRMKTPPAKRKMVENEIQNAREARREARKILAVEKKTREEADNSVDEVVDMLKRADASLYRTLKSLEVLNRRKNEN